MGLRDMVCQSNDLNSSDLEILEQMFRVREHEKKYEKGKLR